MNVSMKITCWMLPLGLALSACGGGGANNSADADADADVDVSGDLAPDVAPDTAGDGELGDTGPEFPDLSTAVPVTPVIQDCGPPPQLAGRSYDATIRWTSYGVPHITADDLGSATFGQGYAVARDHVCVLADQFVMASSERAKYFGPGPNDANITSDLGWLALGVPEKARCALAALSPEAREAVRGFVAGYNQWLSEHVSDEFPEPCFEADWVRPIDEETYMRFVEALVLRGSGQPLIPAIVPATPPEPEATAAPAKADDPNGHQPYLPKASDFRGDGLGSNGWGLGKDRTATGRGMLIANPHFPWQGGLMWHEVQLTVPGELNVHGAALLGTPGVEVGFNDKLGWTHTVSSGKRFTLYALTLHPEDPTVYLYGDELRRMSQRTVSIEVKGDDGQLSTVERTFYASHYGPILDISPLGWRSNIVATYRDANINNFAAIDQFLGMAYSQDLAEFQKVFEDEGGIPWVHTMYADAEGNAFYVDAASLPNLSADTLSWWENAVATGEPGLLGFLAQFAYNSFGAVALDGSDPAREWEVAPGAREPGLLPYSMAPKLANTTFVANANGTHWATNPATPLEGFSPLFGYERRELSMRTRMNLTMLTETGEGAASGSDGLFDFEELKGVRESNRAMMAELLRDGVVARCGGVASVDVDGTSVALGDACDALSGWDGRLNTSSVGAVMWRAFVGQLIARKLLTEDLVFAVPFDVTQPVTTPRGLADAPASGPDPILVALGAAVLQLGKAQFAPDTPLDEAQYTIKGGEGGERIPVPGGKEEEGAFNIVTHSNDSTTLLPKIPVGPTVGPLGMTAEGWVVDYGTSFVMALSFTDEGPEAAALVTYSQSSDPDSPHYSDQTQLFSENTWRQVLFSEADLLDDPGLETLQVSGSDE
ncbi:MAG: acylase [Deltaproteobacteria bacterium]|nr:acylase [Deltaproteobacteria bacterium]MCB9789074.1 acylase [Deltaproteobacteria bacterium]